MAFELEAFREGACGVSFRPFASHLVFVSS